MAGGTALAVEPLRVLVVDDTAVYRQAVREALATLPGVVVVGVASDGGIALAKAEQLRPDLLTLDIEMPVLDGLGVLEQLPRVAPDAGAIVLSHLTRQGGSMTLRALELGAFDYLPKPQGGSREGNLEALRDGLAPRLEAFRKRLEARRRLGVGPFGAPPLPSVAPALAPWAGAAVVGIGTSTGGPNALAKILPVLPGDFEVPVLVVQHMPAAFTPVLAQSLAKRCALPVREARDGEPLVPGAVLLAPGGSHLKVVAGSGGPAVRLTEDPPENGCRPAADVLFRSLAYHFAGRVVAAILTGMGRDGVEGLKALKRTGCRVIAQDEATSVVWGMPGAAVAAGVVDRVVPLEAVAAELQRAVPRRAPRG